MAPLSEIEHFQHDHVFLGASHDDNARRTMWVVALTSIMMVGEIIAESGVLRERLGAMGGGTVTEAQFT